MVATQISNVGFAALLVVAAYVLGDQRFASEMVLGLSTRWLLVTVINALTIGRGRLTCCAPRRFWGGLGVLVAPYL